MIEPRPFNALGGGDHGWLKTRHHFSFADYHDSKRMHWGALRVWNDDEIAANSGFPPHSHSNMEIITYVRRGAITHEDNLGNKGRTEAGDVQVMSAGTGITHAEYNREKELTAIFQIWIIPATVGEAPSWGTKPFPKDNRAGSFSILASGFEDDAEALPIRVDARVLGATVKRGAAAEYRLDEGRLAYAVVASGAVAINGIALNERDGVAIRDERLLEFTADHDAEIVLVDVNGMSPGRI
ncbi:MAG TPA: pirin family protein [Gammaproteobacteria bacterium]